MDKQWLFEAFFNQISNITNHYQYLVVLIIGGSGYIFSNTNSSVARVMASISFMLASANLIVGLFVYNEILNIVFDFTVSPDKANLADPTLKCYLSAQLIVGIISFIFLIASASISAFKGEKNETS